MHSVFKQFKVKALRGACVAICGMCMPTYVYAQEAPLPTVKPIAEEIPVEKAAPSAGFNIVDFTTELLGFSGPPVPARKPANTALPMSVTDKALRKAKKQTPSTKSLSKSEAEIYAKIFNAQRAGDFKSADSLIKDLKDMRLLGHVLFQRYMHPEAYRASFKELRNWLDLYASHPGAQRIEKLAENRKPAGFSGKIQPANISRGITRTYEPSARVRKAYISDRVRSDKEARAVNDLRREIFSLIRQDKPTRAYEELQARHVILDRVETDLLRGEIAAGYLYNGKMSEARTVAEDAVKRSGLHVPKAGWVAGLVAWSNKEYSKAARHFEVVARSPYASGWTVTAGSYWAARAHMRTGNVKAVSMWLKRGIQQPRTFYGLISTRALGRDFDFNWKIPPFTKDYLDVLNENPAANRAIALVAAGQPHLAEAELIQIIPQNDQERKALLAYSAYANLPALALRVATAAGTAKDGAIYDAALYPTGPWEASDDFKIDPALVYAIMRQESRFDPRAKSTSGAQGLMQLMPATAKSVALEGETELNNPKTNLELGQRYLNDLLETSTVDGDILSLLIAYNAGPGNLRKWKKRWPDVTDPLLFIELIPSGETRAYVEKVLSNYWIYRLREGQDTPSLDAIAEGRPALYGGKEL